MSIRKKVKIKFQNGLDYKTAITEILNVVADIFDFEESNEPDFILFGPYGVDVPPKGDYIRIGYYCENITPDLDNCEWAFGIPHETDINSEKYKRIQWHNLEPETLIKKDWDLEAIAAQKTKFCNFLYSTPVYYREEFYRQLSKYKKIDSPGKSMNNMPSIDDGSRDRWGIKRHFLSQYKFTIAFENYVYPGYQTEKLYDAMICKTIPIYCGDPDVKNIFNTNSFLNASDYIQTGNSQIVNLLERYTHPNFTDIRPLYFKSPKNRIQRKLKSIGRYYKMKFQFNKLDFSELIDRIIYLDKNQDAYLDMLSQPWFNNNKVPANTLLRLRWIQIFSGTNG